MLLLLSKQSSAVKVGDKSGGARPLKTKGKVWGSKDELKEEGPCNIWVTER